MPFRRIVTFIVSGLIVASGLPDSPASEPVKLGPVSDDMGVVKINEGVPIIIGGYWTLSGPNSALGIEQKRGVEIALEVGKNKVAGHPIWFIAEDSQCNAEGGQRAATELASYQDIVLVFGPDCSSSAVNGAPILWKAGIPSVGTWTTAPSLTADDRKPGYHGFLQTSFNDLTVGAANAEYFYDVLNCETLATIHDGSPNAEQLVRGVEKRFKELGGSVTAAAAVTPTDVDMRPLLAGIATDKPCVLYFQIFTLAAAQLVRQLPEISGLEDTNIIGGSTLMTPGFLEAAGDAAVGFRFTNSDISPDGLGETYWEFARKYKEKFGEVPIQPFHATAYDAALIGLRALEKIAVTDNEGNTYIGRKALRDMLFATKNVEGVTGLIDCDVNGDCGDYKLAIYEYTGSRPETFDAGVNPKKIYPQ